MALDKQKILNELGHVVNQLQSADCGCMGKLFSNSNQPSQNGSNQNAPMCSPYMGGCCHGHGCGQGCHGYNATGAGEPFSGNRNCMGTCNPQKLYSDTYNYLNNNLMQPVVKEVYDELKSISPANTMMNSPMAAQMGLSQGNNPSPTAQGAIGGQMGNMAQNQMPSGAMGNQNVISNQQHGPHLHFGNSNIGNPNNSRQMANQNSQQQMGQMPMSGMGPNIVNMMLGDTAAKRASKPNQGVTQGGLISNNAPQSPGMEQYNVSMPGHNQGQFNNMGQSNPGASMQNPSSQHMSQPNVYTGANANMQGNVMNGNMDQMNPGSQQMQTMSASLAQPQMNAYNSYGQHNAGMAKFNEMFPGVVQGGDLGFDPMAIAIQMNPANQQRVAMQTMQKIMSGNGKGPNAANALLMQPAVNATNAAVANIAQSNQPPSNQAPSQQNMVPQQPIPGANAAAASVQNNQVPQQHVYTALTGAPTINQQQVPQQQIPSPQQQYQGQYQQQQQMHDPNTGTVVTGSSQAVYESSEDPNTRQEGSPPTGSEPPTNQHMIMEPLSPVDTSTNLPPSHINKFKHQNYNTLGQPIDMLPTDIYRTQVPNLPQTLSPQLIQRSDPGVNNVKATVSKISLMGNKPIGKTPSRSQLQQIYNQYKGSQSATQRNIRPPDGGASYSEGRFNVPQGNATPQAPIEKIGGDTATGANNAVNNPAYTKPNQVGDVPAANKPLADAPLAHAEKTPVNNSKIRNGLQDMKYTSYASSAAWSFHGATPAPYSKAYRFRK